MTHSPFLAPGRLWLAASFLALSNFIVVLDMTVANVSIPHIAGSLGVSLDQGSWVITSYAVAEALMVPLTGWLALRFNDDPRAAARSFDTLVQVAVSPISVARGRYWRGRAAEASGQDPAAHYRAAAAHPATYYGQLAILALGSPVLRRAG